MEENSESHKETAVSSSTDGAAQAPVPASPRRNIETLVYVEKVQEEEMSSTSKDKTKQQLTIKDKILDSSKPLEKSPQNEVPLKKIIIKTANKDFQIVKVVKSATKIDEPQKVFTKVMSPVRIPSNLQSTVNSSSKPIQISPRKEPESKTKSPVKEGDTSQNFKKTPTKDVPISNHNNTSTLSAEVDTSPVKEAEAKDVAVKISPVKTQPIKETSGTETELCSKIEQPGYNVSLNKEEPPKVTSNKIKLNRSTPAKELVKSSPVKDDVAKVSPVKEQVTKPNEVKDVVSKVKDSSDEKVPSVSPDSSKLDEVSKESNSIPCMDIDKEASNDSQMETNSDTSEKEHNKSISRELKSLIKSAKESKIISECTQLTSKTRKSRTPLDTSITSLNTSVDADKIQGVRRCSDNSSQMSGCSERSEKGLKRSMRSQNPEFVNKVKLFLNSVTGKTQKEGDTSEEEVEEVKTKEPSEPRVYTPKKQQAESSDPMKHKKLVRDPYCWRCHWSIEPADNEKTPHPPLHCTVCPRAFHFKCLTGSERSKINQEKSWVCPECMAILTAESSDTRTPAMKKISLGMLCELLKYALERMMDINGVEPFMNPVDRTSFPDYDKYVVHPMYLSQMKDNIAAGFYGSTEAFLADAQWILHNSVIFNTLQSKLTSGARALVRSCRAEMGEIEACPECYAAAHARKPTWFTDVCSTPHILLWAKLKGFPYWPAKGMSVSSAGLVDVRFFGAHDRAWVPAKDCFLYSEKDPNNFRTKRQDILDSMQEAEQHIRNISRKYGKFVYPPFKTQFDPAKQNEQLKLMIPTFEGECRAPVKDNNTASPSLHKDKRTYSKSSKGSNNDGDISEGDETPIKTRKMAYGTEIARDEDDFTVDKDKEKVDKDKEKEKPMTVDTSQSKEIESSRKRRRSDLEEAVITIMDTSVKEKKKRVESEEKQEDKVKNKSSTDKKENNGTPKENKWTESTTDTPKRKDNEPSTSTEGKNTTKVGRLISIDKVLKTAKVNMPKVSSPKESEKPQPKKQKPEKAGTPDKTIPSDEKLRSLRRRSSKGNKSLNSSNTEMTENKTDKKGEKQKPNSTKSDTDKSTNGSANSKDKPHFDDDTILAVIARETKTNQPPATIISRLPTISSVRSLSGAQGNDVDTSQKGLEITVEAPSDSSIFTPTSTNNVCNVKDAADKLQKLRSDTDKPPSQVGRVGVRAFARMTSPPLETRPNNEVQVEIKTEPMDFDDADRHMKKMDLMNAFQLRPVNTNTNAPAKVLRDVRINKVVVTPVVKVPKEVRPRAKKTFPQPKKPDDGRSELNSKNSMVYIPIQPPLSQAPLRPLRPNTSAPPLTPLLTRPTIPANANNASNTVNTVTTPLVPVSIPTITSQSVPISGANTALVPNAPTVGPTTVHTVPIMTSVNGQWTFSLQPVISVGAVDTSAASAPMVNGLPERGTRALPPAVPLALPPAVPPAVPLALPPAVPPALSAPPAAMPPVTPDATPVDNVTTPGEPPRLQQRPQLLNPLDASTPVGNVPPPSTAGQLTAKLNQNAVKMADFFRTLLEDSIEKLDEPSAQVTALKMQLEQMQWRHKQESEELKHNHELAITEMRSSFEKEKARLVSETRRVVQMELEAAVKLAKSKQWCAKCSQEAQFYCCWNTSYCDYACQRAHWSQHFAVCTQRQAQDGTTNDKNSDSLENRRQLENLPKTTAAPNLVPGKMPPNRVFSQDPQQTTPKSTIIMSMVEDSSGTQSVKCVGTYEPPQQMSTLVGNKQLKTNDDASKKVVTTGGYLIVGGSNTTPGNGNNSSPAVTAARRAHAVQYYT